MSPCHNVQPNSQASVQDDTCDLNGKVIFVKYEDQLFIGQVLRVFSDEIEESCMQHLGWKKWFLGTILLIDFFFYCTSDVLKVISKPELTHNSCILLKCAHLMGY